MRPTSFMSPIFAMPTTTVPKMIGAIIIRISLMNASPSGFIAAPAPGIEVAEQDAGDDADNDLEPQPGIERLVGGSRCRHE